MIQTDAKWRTKSSLDCRYAYLFLGHYKAPTNNSFKSSNYLGLCTKFLYFQCAVAGINIGVFNFLTGPSTGQPDPPMKGPLFKKKNP